MNKESGSGVVAVQGEDIYCRIPNTTDACYQVEVVFWLIPVIQTGWKLTCMSHTCAHTCSPPRTRTHTHTHAHSEANNRTYVHSLDTYKNWNTNTNNTTIKTLYCLIFFFRNSYSYVLYSVERQLCFNKWTLFFCLSLKWSVGYHHHNENSYSIYLFF